MALQKKQDKGDGSSATALALADIGITAPLATAMEAERKEFLPYIKIAYGVEGLTYMETGPDGQPIMVNGKPVTAAAAGKLVVSGGGNVVKVPTPYLMTVIIGRAATRELVDKGGDKQGYERTYAPMKGDPSAQHLKQLQRNADGEKDAKGQLKVETGNSYLVAVLHPSTNTPQLCTIGLLEAFKTQLSYWQTPCSSALMNEGNGIVVELEDHKANEIKSKAGFKYYDPRKFSQWKQVRLSPEQEKLVIATIRDKKDAIEGWMKK